VEIGRKIYYEIATGNVIVDTGERSGSVVETTREQDFELYRDLATRVPETVGMIQLEYRQYAEDFAQCNGYRIDPETEEVLFSYPDPDGPEQPIVYRKPLTEQVTALETEVTNAMLAIAEVYEEKEQQLAQKETEVTNAMLAIAELYEMNLQLQNRIEQLEEAANGD